MKGCEKNVINFTLYKYWHTKENVDAYLKFENQKINIKQFRYTYNLYLS